jgi:hypothetical protein
MTKPREFEALAERARAVDLHSLVQSYRLDMKGTSNNLAGSCPQCGGTDRFAVSLSKQTFHCRGCNAKGGGPVDFVMFVEGCSFVEAVEFLTGGTVATFKPSNETAKRYASVTDNSVLAQKLWRARRPVMAGCPVWTYLRDVRGYQGPLPETIGYLPANEKYPDTMIAAFGPCEEPEPGLLAPPLDVRAVHLTRLTPEGAKLAEPDKPAKIMLGPMAGLPIVLAPPGDMLAIYVTEGIEDGLNLFQEYDFGVGIWAAGSAGNMPKMTERIPDFIEVVWIFGDKDEAGVRNAETAARALDCGGPEVKIIYWGDAA